MTYSSVGTAAGQMNINAGLMNDGLLQKAWKLKETLASLKKERVKEPSSRDPELWKEIQRELQLYYKNSAWDIDFDPPYYFL
jgi:hypothetical protein